MFRYKLTWSLQSAIKALTSISAVVTASRVCSATGLLSMMPVMVVNVSGSMERR